MEIGVIEHIPASKSKLDAVKNLGDKIGSLNLSGKNDNSKENDEAPKLAPYEDPILNPDARMEYNINEEEPRKIYLPHPESPDSFCGNVTTQLCRSISDWSHGYLTERSIQNAYISLIRDARFSVYIENQFLLLEALFPRQIDFTTKLATL